MNNNIINKIKKLLNKYIGKTEYVVRLTSSCGEVCISTYETMKEVDDVVDEVNSSTYHMISKIEKIRRLPFQYNKEVLHTPTMFSIDSVTERDMCDDYEYSFLKIHSSLKNVKRGMRNYKEKIVTGVLEIDEILEEGIDPEKISSIEGLPFKAKSDDLKPKPKKKKHKSKTVDMFENIPSHIGS